MGNGCETRWAASNFTVLMGCKERVGMSSVCLFKEAPFAKLHFLIGFQDLVGCQVFVFTLQISQVRMLVCSRSMQQSKHHAFVYFHIILCVFK